MPLTNKWSIILSPKFLKSISSKSTWAYSIHFVPKERTGGIGRLDQSMMGSQRGTPCPVRGIRGLGGVLPVHPALLCPSTSLSWAALLPQLCGQQHTQLVSLATLAPLQPATSLAVIPCPLHLQSPGVFTAKEATPSPQDPSGLPSGPPTMSHRARPQLSSMTLPHLAAFVASKPIAP